MPLTSLTRQAIFQKSWPIILANAAVPLLGLADTAVIGNHGTVEDLGAIALGSLLFSFVYWSFGFLRMGTTGFTAQAAGKGDEAEVRAAIGRALFFGLCLGAGLVALQRPIASVAFAVLSGEHGVEVVASRYFFVRIWGAPATLATFSVMGLLIGLGLSRHLLALQLFLNGLNIALDLWFAGVLGWGARGIALGTAIAEWCTLVLSLLTAYRALRRRHHDEEPFWPLARMRRRDALTTTLRANADIMIRTLFLVFGFAWFTDQGARFGSQILAANHVLLQFVSFSAFFLDGYAHAAESLVGDALGRGDRLRFDLAVLRSSELAGATALLLAAAVFLLGNTLIGFVTDHPSVQAHAANALPWAAVYIFCAFPAFQLDGVFIGATRTKEMRNASILSLLSFLLLALFLTDWLENDGLWLSFVGYVVMRALTLLLHYPKLRAAVTSP